MTLFAALLITLLAASAAASAQGEQSQSCSAPPAGNCSASMYVEGGDHLTGSISINGYSNVVQFWLAEANGTVLHSWGVISSPFDFSILVNQTATYFTYFANFMDEQAFENVTIMYQITNQNGSVVNPTQPQSTDQSQSTTLSQSTGSPGTVTTTLYVTSSQSSTGSPNPTTGAGWSDIDTFGVAAAVIVVASLVTFMRSKGGNPHPSP